MMTSPDSGSLEGYRPSVREIARLAEVEQVQLPDGTQAFQDNSTQPWSATEKQEAFLDQLLHEKDCKLSLYLAMHSIDGTMKELNRWCRSEPGFLMLFRERVRERFEIAEIGADLTVVGASEGELKPTKEERWGVEAILKIRDFLHKKEVRYIQINQQFNMSVSVDQDDEELQRVIDAADSKKT